ncbi:Hypothetical predicted protein [Mytilus galloprovincialis]|uniref:Immunoglobulin subtype domain-containing protein n=1 Tax=Mytilus galloprovincialis TaxID=29158 RepID=A0A8B6G3S9_MYTGA|nr:Hypothetical predicted protein [Mytilus galloprovincialis]
MELEKVCLILIFLPELSFIGQTDIQTIVGQEGKEMTITCSSDTDQYITALKLELNGTAVTLGIIKLESSLKQKKQEVFCDTLQCSFFHICFCVKHDKTIAQRHSHISEDHSDQIDDELSSISFRANNNVSSSNTNNEHDHSSAQTRPSNISVGVNHQSTDESESFATSELPSNFKRTDAQEQRVSIPSSLSNVFNTDDSGILSIENAENCNKINATVISNALSNKNNQTSMESDSESSNNVTVGSDGDGYDNPYETISQEREESHQYTMMSKERHNSFSSIEYHCKDDRLGTTNAKEAIYINLQF